MNRLDCRSDEGVSLLITLVFIAVFGLVIGSILGFASTGEQTTVQLRGQENVVYSASGAIDGAINSIRSSTTKGDDGGPNCDFTMPNTATGLNTTTNQGVQNLTVKCTPQTGSGASGSGSSSNNTPPQAILTLPASTETGLAIQSNNNFKVKGNVFTNGAISIAPGSNLILCGSPTTDPTCLTHPGSVKAKKTCPTAQISATTVVCPDNADAAATDPGYAAPTIDPTARSIGSCPASKVVILPPGTYNDASTLSTMMGGACHAAFYFKPGVFYFNFTNAGSHVWTIGDPSSDVIAGQVQNWDPVANPLTDTRAKLSALITASGPPNCLGNDLNNLANSGAEFVFGGDSQMFVNSDDSVVLCPQPSAASQEISIYGVPPSSSLQATEIANAASTDSSAPSFANGSNAFVSDATHTTYAQASSVTGASTHAAHLTLSFPQTLPAGATVTGVQATIWHYEQPTGFSGNCAQGGSINNVSLSVQLGASTAATVPTANSQCTWNNDSVTLGPTAVTALQSAVNSSSAIDMTYAVSESGSAAKSIDARVDSMQLIVTYTLAVLQGESGCVIATPYPTTGCALLGTSGNGANINIHGTLYAPAAAIDVQLPNQVGQFFGRGLVSRTAVVTPPASNPLQTATFSVPDLGGGLPADRKVLFEAQVNGVAVLRALVQFVDLGGTSPGSQVKVLSWSIVRT